MSTVSDLQMPVAGMSKRFDPSRGMELKIKNGTPKGSTVSDLQMTVAGMSKRFAPSRGMKLKIKNGTPKGVPFPIYRCRWRGSNPHGVATNGF